MKFFQVKRGLLKLKFKYYIFFSFFFQIGSILEYPAEIDMKDLEQDGKEIEDLLDIDEVLQDVINENMKSTKKCHCKGKR